MDLKASSGLGCELVLQDSAIAVSNPGPLSVVTGRIGADTFFFSATGDNINVLDHEYRFVTHLPFSRAFPTYSEHEVLVAAVAFDQASGRLASVSDNRVAIWEKTRFDWRVHSSFIASSKISAIDYSHDRIAIGGEGEASVWRLTTNPNGLPVWHRVNYDATVTLTECLKLSPAGDLLASVDVDSNIVKIFAISSDKSQLQLTSFAAHALKVRSIAWRPTDDPGSDPVLFTTTADGLFRIWSCMIDEPGAFSLWATLDVHANSTAVLPLATVYYRTTPGENYSTQDEFITVFSDGSVYHSTVMNYDARPPSCLTQTSQQLYSRVFLSRMLPNLRYTTLVSLGENLFTLVCRCSQGTLLKVTLEAPRPQSQIGAEDITSSGTDTRGSEPPVVQLIPLNLAGHIRQISHAFSANSLLVLGDARRIQRWSLGESRVIMDTFASEAVIDPSYQIASWDDSRFLALVNIGGIKIYEFLHTGHLQLLAHQNVPLTPIRSVSVAKARADATECIVIVLTERHEVLTWTYDTKSTKLSSGATQVVVYDDPVAYEHIEPVPLPYVSTSLQREKTQSTILIMALDAEGVVTFWCTTFADAKRAWKPIKTIETEKKNVSHVSCNEFLKTAIVAKEAPESPQLELSIWDLKESQFSSGEEYSIRLDTLGIDEVSSLSWSLDGQTLALSTKEEIMLFSSQRLQQQEIDSKTHSWKMFSRLSMKKYTPSPITHIHWIKTGVAVATETHLLFFSSTLLMDTPSVKKTITVKDYLQEINGPLPYYHPQLLFQTLVFHGNADAVTQILIDMASLLTPEGDLTPIINPDLPDQINVDTFLTPRSRADYSVRDVGSREANGKNLSSTALYSALRNLSLERQKKHSNGRTRTGLLFVDDDKEGTSKELTKDLVSRLAMLVEREGLRGLNSQEHQHFSILLNTIYDLQIQKKGLDENGLRYLLSMESYYLYHRQQENDVESSEPQQFKNFYVWAMHSRNQEVIIEAAKSQVQPNKMGWSDFRLLGLCYWVESVDRLKEEIDQVGRYEYIRKGLDDRDPILPMLFYVALRKKNMVLTFWKQSYGHRDRSNMIKLLSNDFSEQRWRTAANKNAYALLSKKRFLFAAAFFLLGDSLKDAVSVLVKQVGDIELALTVIRLYEDDVPNQRIGPVFEAFLKETILPRAFAVGNKWLLSYSFWTLGRRSLANECLVTPLKELALRISDLAPALDKVTDVAHEDPGLVILYKSLQSYSLGANKGSSVVSGHTEFNFVIYMCKILCKMGCHVLALNLARSWQFPRRTGADTKESYFNDTNGEQAVHEFTGVHASDGKNDQQVPKVTERDRPLEQPQKTSILDIDLNANAVKSLPSKTNGNGPIEASNEEKDIGAKPAFTQPKKAPVIPPEFDMGAFNF